MKYMQIFLGVLIFCVLGCASSLRPRKEALLVKPPSLEVQALRKTNADLKAKLLDYEEQIRSLEGLLEESEKHSSDQLQAQSEVSRRQQEELEAYKASLAELNNEKKQLTVKVQDLKLSKEQALRKPEEHLKRADGFFDDKQWMKAVEEYQFFREKAPNKKSQDYALVTYKIGVCFQELGMEKEAQTFYKSVLSKHKKHKAAKYASYRLSQLKKSK